MKSLLPILFLSISSYGVVAQNSHSINFDGQNGAVNFGNSSQFEIGKNLSIEAWVKVSSQQVGPWGRIIDKFHFNRAEGYNLVVNVGDNTARFEIATISGMHHITSAKVIADDQWHHLAASFDGDMMRIYVDGQMENSLSLGNETIVPSSNPLEVGCSEDGNGPLPIVGKIDQVRIWNRLLSDEDVVFNKDNCLTGNEVGLVGAWDFNTGAVVLDITANGNHGVPTTSGAAIDEDVPYACELSQLNELTNSNVTAYPNPMNDKTSIQIPASVIDKYCNVSVYSITGELMVISNEVVQNQRVILNKGLLSNGIYIVELKTNSFLASTRIVVE